MMNILHAVHQLFDGVTHDLRCAAKLVFVEKGISGNVGSRRIADLEDRLD